MHPRFFNGFTLAFLWLVVSIVVFSSIDALATREVPLDVERFRRPGMSDEEVVAAAVQEAFRVEPNFWWIHDKTPLLVFDPARTYFFDPQNYENFRIEINARHRLGIIGLLYLRR